MKTYPVYLNGDFVCTEETIPVVNPATDEVVAHMSTINRERNRVDHLTIKQQFKIWKLLLAGLYTLSLIMVLVFYFAGRSPSLGTVNTLTIIFMIIFLLGVLINIIIWILRLLNLLTADIRLKREEVYAVGEKVTRKPQGEMVVYQREENVDKEIKAAPTPKGNMGSVDGISFNKVAAGDYTVRIGGFVKGGPQLFGQGRVRVDAARRRGKEIAHGICSLAAEGLRLV